MGPASCEFLVIKNILKNSSPICQQTENYFTIYCNENRLFFPEINENRLITRDFQYCFQLSSSKPKLKKSVISAPRHIHGFFFNASISIFNIVLSKNKKKARVT